MRLAMRGLLLVAAVEILGGTARVAREGLVAPLILQFASERPIYPLALTATVGTETEIVIYTLSDNKLTCGDRLTLRHATQSKAQEILKLFSMTAAVEEWPVFSERAGNAYDAVQIQGPVDSGPDEGGPGLRTGCR